LEGSVTHRLGCWTPWLFLSLLAACSDDRQASAPGLQPHHYLIKEGEVPSPGKFLRYREADSSGGGLDIAVTEYESSTGGPGVVLIGVVHVADAPYYVAVTEVLEQCDVVLWEGVKPSEATAADWLDEARTQDRDLSGLQRQLAQWFGFQSQLAAIDYDRPHFVHADMSMEEFVAAGGDRFLDMTGARPASGAFESRGGGASSRRERLPNEVKSTWDAVAAFGELALSKPGPLRSLARRMFAETMGSVDVAGSLDMFPGMSDLILTQRNAVVMEKLEHLLPTTEGRIGIFYGAAHMPELEEELIGRLGYRRVSGRWLRAWALRPPIRR